MDTQANDARIRNKKDRRKELAGQTVHEVAWKTNGINENQAKRRKLCYETTSSNSTKQICCNFKTNSHTLGKTSEATPRQFTTSHYGAKNTKNKLIYTNAVVQQEKEKDRSCLAITLEQIEAKSCKISNRNNQSA